MVANGFKQVYTWADTSLIILMITNMFYGIYAAFYFKL
jgi:hypothetical protein